MQKNSNIVFVVPNYLPAPLSGSEIIVRDLAESLGASGFQPTVVTSNVLSGRSWYDPFYKTTIPKKQERINNVNVIRLRCRPYISALLFIFNKLVRLPRIEVLSWGPMLDGLQQTLVNLHPAVILLSPFPAGLCYTGMELCKRLGIPYCVIPFFKKDQRLFKNLLLRRILNNAHAIFAPTYTEMQYLKTFTNNTHIRLLPSSVDDIYIRKHRSAIDRLARKLRHKYNKKKIVLFVGNKGIGKGVIDAAEAVKKLKRSDVVLISLGKTTKQWDTYLKENRLYIEDIPYKTGIEKFAYYACCDVLILPSTTDNFPIVFLEAWEFKKPVVAYDFYTIRELLTDGSGLLVPPHSIGELAKSVQTIIDSPDLANRIGRIGYNKVRRFARERVTTEYFLPVL